MKKDAVDGENHAKMIAVTTQLNTPGPDLVALLKLAADGIVTGASVRDFASYGHDIALPADFAPPDKALLTDP